MALVPRYGTFPVRMLNSTAPSEYTSAAGVSGSPRACSGAI